MDLLLMLSFPSKQHLTTDLALKQRMKATGVNFRRHFYKETWMAESANYPKLLDPNHLSGTFRLLLLLGH